MVVRFAPRGQLGPNAAHAAAERRATSLRMHFAGSEQAAEPVGLLPIDAKANYFLGTEPSEWTRGSALHEAVRYPDVYPGVDFEFTDDGGRLAYRVTLEDGRMLPRVEFGLQGYEGMRVVDGKLEIETDLGTAVWSAPLAYWDSEAGREPVSVAYKLDESGRISFEIAGPLRPDPLVIDPTLSFATFLGGAGGDFINALTVAPNGNIIVSGSTSSTNYPVTPGSQQSTLGGAEDVFVTVIRPDGSEIVSSTYLGGRGTEITNGLTLLSDGSMAFCGPTTSADYPTTPDALDSVGGGGSSVLVSVLSAAGDNLEYSSYLSGSGVDNCLEVLTNTQDHLLISGYTSSTDFPVTADAVSPTFQGGEFDGFLTVVDPAQPRIVHSTFIGGSGTEFQFFQLADPRVGGIGFVLSIFSAMNADGDIYLAGTTGSLDFLTTPGAFSRTLNGPLGVFVARLDGDDYSVKASTLLGGSGSENLFSVAITSDGRVVVGGTTSSQDFPIAGAALQPSYGGGELDAFVAILDADLQNLEYSSYVGGSSFEALFTNVDAADRLLISGLTGSDDLPTTPDALQSTFSGITDTYFLQLDPSDGSRIFATYIGSPAQDTLSRPRPTPDGGVLLFGGTSSPALVSTPGVLGETYFGGPSDGALVKFGGASPAASILHGGSFLGGLAPNTWTSVFLTDAVDADTRLWDGPDFVNSRLPTNLDGFRVTFNGTPGFVSFISPTQFNVLTPVAGVSGAVQIEIASNEGPIAVLSATAAEFAPGFFMFSPQQRRYVAAVHADGAFVGPADLFGGAVTMRPAAPGDTIQVFGAGFGPTAGGVPEGEILVFDLARDQLANEVRFEIGGVTVTPSFAGLVAAGLYQFNLTIPQLSEGDHAIRATVGGFSTQTSAFVRVAGP